MNRGATGVYWERPHSQTWLSTSLHFVAATRRGRARRGLHACAANSASVSTTRPMMFWGVEAPPVRPMERGPRRGSQSPVMTSSGRGPCAIAPSRPVLTGRCRTSSGDTRAFFMTLWRPCSRNDGRSCDIRWG